MLLTVFSGLRHAEATPTSRGHRPNLPIVNSRLFGVLSVPTTSRPGASSIRIVDEHVQRKRNVRLSGDMTGKILLYHLTNDVNIGHVTDWIGLSSVLRPRQHSIGYMGDGFYRSKDPTNSIKVLKEQIVHRNIKHISRQ